MNEQIIEQLEQVFKHAFELVSHNFANIERVVKGKMQMLGQGLLQRTVNLKLNGYLGSSIACKCGYSTKFIGIMPASIYGIAARYFLVKGRKQQKDGLSGIWRYCGTDVPGSY